MSQTSSILYPKEDNIDETIRRADKKDEHGGVQMRVFENYYYFLLKIQQIVYNFSPKHCDKD